MGIEIELSEDRFSTDSIASHKGDNFPVTRELMAPAARVFNQKMQEHWASIQEFLKLHYVLSQRSDSEFSSRNTSSS